jgi:hypothetical protein
MAGEWKLIYETELPIPFTCADGTGIEKGALLKLSDPMTVATQDGDEDIIAGVAATEKIASDGKTKIAVYRGGIFKATASGSITVGDTLAASSASGRPKTADATCVASKTLGISLETATDGETFLLELRPASNNKAYS